MYLRQAALTWSRLSFSIAWSTRCDEGEGAAEAQVGGELAGDAAVLGARQPAQVEQADAGLVELLLA